MRTRPSKFVLLVLFSFFLVLAASMSFVIYTWNLTKKHAELAMDELSEDARVELTENFRDKARMLKHLNTSTLHLARVLGSSLFGNLSSFATIDREVAPILFLAYSASSIASQVWFVGEDGLFFSYYVEGNRTRAMFSNTSVPLLGADSLSGTTAWNGSGEYLWYSQAINESTGLRYGEAMASFPQLPNSTWLRNAFEYNDGRVSWGVAWGKDREPLLVFSALVKAFGSRSLRGVHCIGVPVKVLMNSINSIDLHGGTLYLATEDGRVLAPNGPPNTQIVLDNGTVWVHVNDSKSSLSEQQSFRLSCKINDDSTLANDSLDATHLDIQQFRFYCDLINVAEVNLVSVLAFPRTNKTNHLHKMSTIAVLLLSAILIIVAFASFVMLQWIRKYRRLETFLRASLIKQKEKIQQAERKSMNKSLAFASASHDVRTSLAGITGLIELCRAEVSPQSALDKSLEQMNVCASKLLGILNSVLDTSKVEAGKMHLEEAEFDMAQVLEESVDIFHVVALKKGLEVTWDPCDNSVLKSSNVKGDSRRLKQILDNLLGNAVKFTSEGHVVLRAWAKKPSLETSTLSINYGWNFTNVLGPLSRFCFKNNGAYDGSCSLYSTQRDTDSIEFVFEVDDSGLGIPKEKRTSVFENYVQVKESISGAPEGTGLGLGIVQSYVRLMGGEIDILDKEPGEKGTCFRFNIFLKSIEALVGAKEADMNSYDGQVPNELHKLNALIINRQQQGPHTVIQSNERAITFNKGLKQEGIHVVLLIQGEETRRISQRWLENLGIKVWVVDHWELFSSTLEMIKHKLFISHFSAPEKSDRVPLSVYSNISSSYNYSGAEMEGFSTLRDGFDHTLPPNMINRDLDKKTSFRNSSAFVLVLIDMSYGSILDTCFMVNNFVKNINNNQYKVVWLANSNTPATELRSLRNRHAPCDLILHKPFHGSRLYAILKLLQEFGGTGESLSETRTKNTLQEACPTKSSSSKEKTHMSFNSAPLQSCSPTHQRDEMNSKLNNDKPLHGMNILVVEDNVVLRHLSSATLSRLGATIECSENGEDALNLVRKALREIVVVYDESNKKSRFQGVSRHFPYDFILMDCEMPIMDGYEATRQIRAEEKQYGLHIPIIALTAHSMAEQETKFIQAGMDLHLMKPLRADMLLDAIRRINHS